MRVAVVGMWHLGTVTAACLAAAGHDVVGIDDDSELINKLRQGLLPVSEPGLKELTRSQFEAGRLLFSSDMRSLGEAEVVWITYDTPVNDSDCADVDLVLGKVIALYPYLNEQGLLLISSQLPVGSTRKLEQIYRDVVPKGEAGFAYSPENLRLGRAIEAFARPERVVVGTRDITARNRIRILLRPLTENIEWMSVESAEMTKHALNAFLATSVAFINELATVCERVGADAREVEKGLKTDVRIGQKAYLRPGQAFGGGTLARDISFLIQTGQSKGLPINLFSGVQRSNDSHKEWPCRKLLEVLGELAGRRLTVLGLTYKPGTDTLRRSPAVELCQWAHRRGATVTAYDPAIQMLPPELARFIGLQATCEAALRGACAVYLATEWPEFEDLTADKLLRWTNDAIVIDPGRFLENVSHDPRIHYFSIGSVQ